MIRLLIAFILPFQVFVVAPFTFYFGNRAEINLSFQQVLIFLGFCFFVFSVFFYVALLCTPPIFHSAHL